MWAYFLLLILEGALRKWVLPGLATPLLIVRDPVALWMLWEAWRRGVFPMNGYVLGAIAITLISLMLTMLIGHGNLSVALFGARITLFHFPLMFLIGAVLKRDELLSILRAVLWIALPMAVLIALQFNSPQSAWVNRGIGGDMEGGGFSGAMGYLRPPGTFSFTNGITQFFSLVGVCVVYF
ncbi:MAG: hypothetical protein WBA12_01045, partial [Catalinimonas sp.]